MNDTKRIIRELNRLDLDNIEYKIVSEKIKFLVYKIPMFVQMSKSTERYFRARIMNDGELTSISQIYAPPKHLVKGYQRCNPPNKPMFYTSSKRLTTLLECSAEVGDTVYLSQWMNREPLPVNSILNEKTSDTYYQKITPEQSIILAYLDTIFTRKIHSSFSNHYKITSAITEIITDNFQPNIEQKISSNKKVGLLFPSIHDIKGSYNTVFYPEFIEERMELQHIMKLKVTRKIGNEYKVKVIDNAMSFEEGKIRWLNNPNNIPLLLDDKGKVPFMWDGKKWNILVEQNNLTNKKISLMLNE